MKKALGKGIQAFIPEEYGILKDETFAELEVDRLRPNPIQPRQRFDERGLEELAQSIRETGVLQPIIAVPADGGYQILTGERRWRAAKLAGLAKVPVLVRNIPKDKQLEVSLIENLQREDLNPIEVAAGFRRLVDELGYKQDDVADKVGKDRASVANFLRLLRLPEEIQDALRQGRLAMGHAKAILGLEDPKRQIELARRIVKRGLSVREAESLVAGARAPRSAGRKARRDPDLTAVEEDLLGALGTKVVISGNARRGTIRVFYFSLDELNRLIEIFKGVKA